MTTNPNMEAIETITVGATSVSSITFSNIPQTYTDLVLKLSTRSTDASPRRQLHIKYNDSSSNYTGRLLYGEDGGVGSDTLSGSTGGSPGFLFGITCGDTATANTFGSAEVYIPNYAGSNNKSSSTDSVIENNSTVNYDNWLTANLWSDSSAITKISVTLSAGNFKQYSTATLYGVTSAGYGAKATGGIVTSDADYVYHTFYSSGTFTPTQNLTCDYLVVAGGGGGGGVFGSSLAAGGGGAGGFRTATGFSVTASTNYTVTVGAGGTNGTGTTRGTNGSNSVFSTITSSGGGVGASRYGDGAENTNGGNGGSGGGGRGGTTTNGIAPGTGGTGNSGSYSPVEGYAGGNGQDDGSRSGGGGGGASEAGNTDAGSDGGDGSVFNGITYAGGGGGGQGSQAATYGIGGAGGGGNGGAAEFNGTSGSANTGGGGGGGGRDANDTQTVGGSGGSGIVIVRYAK